MVNISVGISPVFLASRRGSIRHLAEKSFYYPWMIGDLFFSVKAFLLRF